MSPAETFISEKTKLANILKRWWQYEDEEIDFVFVLGKLRLLVNQCPDEFAEQFQLELIEIENDLREYGLIE